MITFLCSTLFANKVRNETREVRDFWFSHDVLHEKQLIYLSCLLDLPVRIPRGRLLVKIHKEELGARLIAAGTRWLTNPHALMSAKFLQPLVLEESSIAKDTQDVLSALESVKLNPASKIASFDVEQLYPSMDPTAVAGSIRIALTAYYNRHPVRRFGALIEALMMILHIVFAGQVLSFNFNSSVGKGHVLYTQAVGITTGLACAVQLANLYQVLM